MKIIGKKLNEQEMLQVKGGIFFCCTCNYGSGPYYGYQGGAGDPQGIADAEEWANSEHCGSGAYCGYGPGYTFHCIE
ncbi:hypothetical protein [uncultured Roseivirga sp.]|uniref:hypothetical protein n=1 Tax=uncultured Roseivirga sp. TaxID=543088 RepID=UPI0030DB428B|tara:strand:- start:4016 stop:4246 length:231 start_codon:yes stop_codon:yes gene_type:complete